MEKLEVCGKLGQAPKTRFMRGKGDVSRGAVTCVLPPLHEGAHQGFYLSGTGALLSKVWASDVLVADAPLDSLADAPFDLQGVTLEVIDVDA